LRILTTSVGLLLAIVAVAAICYPAVKTGLAFAPPLRFAGLRTLIGGAILPMLLVAVVVRLQLAPERPAERVIAPQVPSNVVQLDPNQGVAHPRPAVGARALFSVTL